MQKVKKNIQIKKIVLSLFLVFSFVVSNLSAETIKFWTTEEQPDRLAKQESLAEDFKAKTGHTVEVIPVTEKDLGTRATAAFAAGDLPDVIYFTLQYVLPWANAGILDVDANNEVVNKLGVRTFSQGPINIAKVKGKVVAVPVDGWTQLIVYRKDLFDRNNLKPPHSYANIERAIKKLHNPPNLYGFVAPTKIDENFMSQVLEHVFLANGVSPVNNKGFRRLDRKKTTEVLNFYRTIVKASPPGELYWKQSRELYFAGKAAMIIWSPFILDELAGLRDSAPPTINSDPTSKELASKTGVVTTFSGPSNPKGASWADIRYFGVTADAETEVAQQFIEYSMNEGYEKTLSIAPEGKFPVRKGDKRNPNKFTEIWSKLPVGVDRKAPLSDLYSKATIDRIVKGLDTADRWGVKEGQLELASNIINSQVINRLVREFIDGERNARQTVDALNRELSKIKN